MASRRTKTVVGTSLGAGAIAAGAGAVAVARRGARSDATHPDGSHPWGHTAERLEASEASAWLVPIGYDTFTAKLQLRKSLPNTSRSTSLKLRCDWPTMIGGVPSPGSGP